MSTPETKNPKPAEVTPEPADLAEVESRMADYLLNGEIDGEAFDGDPADWDLF